MTSDLLKPPDEMRDLVMRQGRWKNERVCQGYIRPATIFVNNATDGLGDEPEKKR